MPIVYNSYNADCVINNIINYFGKREKTFSLINKRIPTERTRTNLKIKEILFINKIKENKI